MSPSARSIVAFTSTGGRVSFVTVTGASPSDAAAFPARSSTAPADMFRVGAPGEPAYDRSDALSSAPGRTTILSE